MVYRKSFLHSSLYSEFSPLYRQLSFVLALCLSLCLILASVASSVTSPPSPLPATVLSLANGVTRASQRVTHNALTMSTARELDLNLNLKRERKTLYKIFSALSKFPTSSGNSCTSFFPLPTITITIIIRHPANCIAIRFILAE